MLYADGSYSVPYDEDPYRVHYDEYLRGYSTAPRYPYGTVPYPAGSALRLLLLPDVCASTRTVATIADPPAVSLAQDRVQFLHIAVLAMPDARPEQPGALTLGQAEALLAGVLAAAKAALPEGLDVLVWGAARLGDQATLRHLLATGGGYSWTPSKDDEVWGRDTSLRVASRFGHEGAVKELLESGVDVNEVRTDTGVTALYLAAQEGHEGVVEQLLKAEVDVNKATTDDGATPLCIAAMNGHEGVVEELLKAEADVNKAMTNDGITPLYIAAQNGHEGVVEQLLQAEADVNKARTDFGTTPLCIAAQEGHEGVVEQLLKAEADVNKAKTNDGTTPLYVAAHEGHEGVVEQLLKAGADPNTETTLGTHRSPLSIASFKGDSRVCSLLLEAGANVNHANGNEGPALMTAVTHGHREVALVLVEHGASDDTLTPPMLKTLYKWTAEALKEKNRVIAEKNRQMDEMVQGIPEWCAQTASSVAAEQGQNDGSSSSSAAD